MRGYAYLSQNQYTEALKAFEQATYLNPNDAPSRHAKAVALNWLDRHEEALAAIEQAIRLDPNNALLSHLKGVLLENLGRKRKARQAYARARQPGHKE